MNLLDGHSPTHAPAADQAPPGAVSGATAPVVDDHGAVPMARPVLARGRPTLHPMFLGDFDRRNAWEDIVIVTLAAVLLTVALTLLIHPLATALGVGDLRWLNMGLTMARGLLVLAILAVVLRLRGQGLASIGLGRQPFWYALSCGVGAGIVGFLAVLAVAVGIMEFYPAGAKSLIKNQQTIVESLPSLSPVSVVMVMITVGLYEEVLFRGFLLTRLRRALGSSWGAVVIVAILFALPHAGSQETIAVVPIFALGLAWGILALALRSIVPLIIGHALFNSVQFILMTHT